MAAWLYPISKKADRQFVLDDGTKLGVSVDTFKKLAESGKLAEDEWWYVSQNHHKVKRGDEIYIYTGDQDLGIIGYATVRDKRGTNRATWEICLNFDLNKCRMLIKQPIPARVVRQWIHYPRNAVRNLQPFQSEIDRLLPWSSKGALGEKLSERTGKVPKRGTAVSQVRRKSTLEYYEEGAVREITKELRYRTRNRRLREDVIRVKGLMCEICGFDFEETYGDLGAGYIEVHHLRPLSELSEGETVQVSLDDVTVVCANCHRVLHRNGAQPIPMEELRQTITKRRRRR